MTTSERRRAKRAAAQKNKINDLLPMEINSGEAPSDRSTSPTTQVDSNSHVGKKFKSAHIIKLLLNKMTIKSGFDIFFKFISLIGFAYLITDRYYETSATIGVISSDPKNPFLFPFSLTNNSHIFRISHIRWRCIILKAVLESGETFLNAGLEKTGISDEIEPGGTLDLECNFRNPNQKFLELTMAIYADYDAYLFGLIPTPRQPRTMLHWASNASNPQWIKGNFLLNNLKDLPP